jgi:hypothetical protein
MVLLKGKGMVWRMVYGVWGMVWCMIWYVWCGV